MGILHDNTPAEDFVLNMHSSHVTLNAFVRLFNMWVELTPDERQEVYDICEYNHSDMYHGVFPTEDDDEDFRNS